MESNELRIGNWVQLKNRYVKIISIAHEDNEDYVKCLGEDLEFLKSLNPIPLTHELLVKIGFEKLPGSKSVYRIIVGDLEISISVDLFYAYIDTQWGQASIKKPIFKHLHQLQNLYFALTQKELPITNL